MPTTAQTLLDFCPDLEDFGYLRPLVSLLKTHFPRFMDLPPMMTFDPIHGILRNETLDGPFRISARMLNELTATETQLAVLEKENREAARLEFLYNDVRADRLNHREEVELLEAATRLEGLRTRLLLDRARLEDLPADRELREMRLEREKARAGDG